MKLFIETLGCPKNFNDSEGIAGIWEKSGGELTETPEEADAILVNTCAFINDAKVESIDRIFDMARIVSEGSGSSGRKQLLIVAGCLGERYGRELLEEIPEADVVMGVNDYESLPEIVRDYTERRAYSGACPDTFREFSARKLPENPYSSTLRISEGCNNRCAYCVIPHIRGGYRSRPMESILKEAAEMAEAGTREIMLIAQDVTEYGRDLYGKMCLPELLRKLCRIDGIRWIRLMYCYEDKITEELMQVMAEEEKICRYIDIPLQHISDNVLRGMRRRSTSESIRTKIRRLREAVPGIHIRTTFITGFPGETEEDFEELACFAEEARFERLGVFAYSREEGTPAGDMECQIDEDVKAARADSIMRLQVDISRETCESKIGSEMTVIVEGPDDESASGDRDAVTYIGRSEFDAPEIDGSVIFRDLSGGEMLKAGDFVRVRIDDAFDYDLTGTMIERI